MRIAVVHNFHSEDVPSGENEVVRAEISALTRAGHEVLFAGADNDARAGRPLGAVQGAFSVATGMGISPLRALGDRRPDVIHVHSLFPYLGRSWLPRSTAPVVTTVHNYRALCANGYLFRDGELCTLCADGRRWSGVRHGCYRGSRLATLPLAWAGRRGAARDPLLVSAQRILVLSERARTVLSDAGVPESRMTREWHFVPDDVDPGMGTGREDTWLFVGRLSPEKGIDRLVAEWPAAERLRVVGDGSQRRSLEAAAAGKPIEFIGHLPRSEVLSQMRRCFGLAFPSRWYETFGLGYIEGLAAGLPTLAFRPNVVADSVEAEGTGAVAAWGGLAPALAEARLSFDGLRARCRTVFEQRYTESAFVTRRQRLYEGLAR